VFVAVIDRAIAKNPVERYPTAGTLEADLLRSIDDDTLPLTVPGTDAKKEAIAPSRHSRRRHIAVIAGMVAAIVIAGGLLAWPALRDRGASSVAATAPIRSIAVLPLVNLSGNADQEYFADAMTDELIGTLGQLRGVNVISRTSAMQFKGTGKPVREIARALNVDAVLEGTVLVTTDTPGGDEKPQKRVRINERLILAGTDTQLWNRTFEHVLTDVLSLQSEVANAVAMDLHVRLTPEEQRAFGGAGSQISDAQDAYLEGRSYLTNTNATTLMRARQALERAVRLDPRYARAHAGLATSYVWLELVGALPRGEARMLAMNAARRALAVDPNLAEAHAALAVIEFYYDWNWTDADAEFRRALALNPNYSFARGEYAWYLAAQGQMAEAVRQATLAADADPLSPEANGAVGMMLYFDRKYDDALRQLLRAATLGPNGAQEHGGLSRVYAAKRDFPNAIREMQEAVRLSGNAPIYLAGLARVYAAAGNAVQARAFLGRAQMADPAVLALVYAALGDRDRAFDLLDRSVRARSSGVLWARVDPRLDSIRADVRFAPFVARLGGGVPTR